MNILREWERDRPKEALLTLESLWRDFERRRADPKSPICYTRDNIPDWCRDTKHPSVALWKAVLSRRPNGKMHNHQSKVSASLPILGLRLSRRLLWLKQSSDFDELYTRIERLAPKGIGPMTVYDVAVRFGAHLGIEPEAVYLHAGTLAGLRSLGIEPPKGVRAIPMPWMPLALATKRPDDVEDFLCTYRLAFETLNIGRDD